MLGLAAPLLAAETQGRIKSVDTDKNKFVMTDKEGKDWTFQVNKGAKIQVGTKDSKLNDLKTGDDVTVTYEKVADNLIAKEIRCERK
jgi:Cu/Ag efflux protein CusF